MLKAVPFAITAVYIGGHKYSSLSCTVYSISRPDSLATMSAHAAWVVETDDDDGNGGDDDEEKPLTPRVLPPPVRLTREHLATAPAEELVPTPTAADATDAAAAAAAAGDLRPGKGEGRDDPREPPLLGAARLTAEVVVLVVVVTVGGALPPSSLSSSLALFFLPVLVLVLVLVMALVLLV